MVVVVVVAAAVQLGLPKNSCRSEVVGRNQIWHENITIMTPVVDDDDWERLRERYVVAVSNTGEKFKDAYRGRLRVHYVFVCVDEDGH